MIFGYVGGPVGRMPGILFLGHVIGVAGSNPTPRLPPRKIYILARRPYYKVPNIYILPYSGPPPPQRTAKPGNLPTGISASRPKSTMAPPTGES